MLARSHLDVHYSSDFAPLLYECVVTQCANDVNSAEALAQQFCNVASPSVSLSFPASGSANSSASTSASSSALCQRRLLSKYAMPLAEVTDWLAIAGPEPRTPTLVEIAMRGLDNCSRAHGLVEAMSTRTAVNLKRWARRRSWSGVDGGPSEQFGATRVRIRVSGARCR